MSLGRPEGGIEQPAALPLLQFLVGGEWRWQNGSADLAPELNFAGDKLDLGGNSVMATFHFKF